MTSRRRTSRRIRSNRRRALKRNAAREIRVYYEIVTPESAEYGDAAERGELASILLTHDDLDEDNPSWVDAAVRALRHENVGSLEADAYGRGAVPRWFREVDGDIDYRTGEVTTRSFHPKGFNDKEMVEMARRLGAYR